MKDQPRSSRGIGERSQALDEAVASVADPMDVALGLPDQIEPGKSALTFMANPWGDPDLLQAQDMTFDWDGCRSAAWTEDVSRLEAITPASSSPSTGFASWQNGEALEAALAEAGAGATSEA